MSITTCAMTGKILENPVLSRRSGHVFEKADIVAHIERTGQCPVTGNELNKDELIEIKTNNNLEIKASQDIGGVPVILNKIQSEWDSLVLDNFKIKKQLKDIKEEIAHNLYLHQSASLVICRLIKERDEAVRQLGMFKAHVTELQQQEEEDAAKDEEFENMGIYDDLVDRINDLSLKLTSLRKKREISKNLATVDIIKNYKVKGAYPLHSATKQGVTCVDIHPTQDQLILTGGVDGKGIVFDYSKEKTLFTVDNIHTKKLNSVKFYPSKETLGFLLCGTDNLATFWTADEDLHFSEYHRILNHKNSITSASFHPLGDYCLLTSRDKSWSFHNLIKGVCITKLSTETEKELTKCEFHPDGIIFATGNSNGLVEIWDVTAQKPLSTLEAHKSEINGISFSENGVYFATSSLKENHVNLWDLRKSQIFKTIELPEKYDIRNIRFDHSGLYLGIAGSSTVIYHMKSWDVVAEFKDNTDLVTDVNFGLDSKFFATTSMDRNLRIYS